MAHNSNFDPVSLISVIQSTADGKKRLIKDSSKHVFDSGCQVPMPRGVVLFVKVLEHTLDVCVHMLLWGMFCIFIVSFLTLLHDSPFGDYWILKRV